MGIGTFHLRGKKKKKGKLQQKKPEQVSPFPRPSQQSGVSPPPPASHVNNMDEVCVEQHVLSYIWASAQLVYSKPPHYSRLHELGIYS